MNLPSPATASQGGKHCLHDTLFKVVLCLPEINKDFLMIPKSFLLLHKTQAGGFIMQCTWWWILVDTQATCNENPGACLRAVKAIQNSEISQQKSTHFYGLINGFAGGVKKWICAHFQVQLWWPDMQMCSVDKEQTVLIVLTFEGTDRRRVQK